MPVPKELSDALDGFEIDLKAWRMGDKNAFAQAAGSADESAAFPLAAKVIKKWPFTGDPEEVKSYEALDFEEWAKVYKAVISAVALRFRAGA